MTQNTDKTLTLRSGRVLGYAEYGEPDSQRSILFCHGWPASRLSGHLAGEVAARHGARLIAFDRPGHGLSEFQPTRTLFSWADDVLEVAGKLGLGQFAVLAFSGGSPYAAVCAYKLPQHVTRVAIMAGTAPLDAPGVTQGMAIVNRFLFRLGRLLTPRLLTMTMRMMLSQIYNHPERYMSQHFGQLPGANEAAVALLTVDVVESFRGGFKGPALDLSIISGSWGFRPADISVDVQLWYSRQDRNVPPAMGHYLAQTIPHSRIHLYDGGDHATGIESRLGEAIAALLS